MKNEQYALALLAFRRNISKDISDYDLINYLNKLTYFERKLNRFACQWCNGEIEENDYNTLTKKLETKVKNICALLNLQVTFQSDPRGAYICFIMPDKSYNSFDGETYRLSYVY